MARLTLSVNIQEDQLGTGTINVNTDDSVMYFNFAQNSLIGDLDIQKIRYYLRFNLVFQSDKIESTNTTTLNLKKLQYQFKAYDNAAAGFKFRLEDPTDTNPRQYVVWPDPTNISGNEQNSIVRYVKFNGGDYVQPAASSFINIYTTLDNYLDVNVKGLEYFGTQQYGNEVWYFRTFRAADGVESVAPTVMYIDGTDDEITSIRVAINITSPSGGGGGGGTTTKEAKITFYDGNGKVIGQEKTYTMSSLEEVVYIDALASSLSIPFPMTKADSNAGNKKYTVRYYVSKESSTIIKTKTISTQGGSISYEHAKSDGHYMFIAQNQTTGGTSTRYTIRAGNTYRFWPAFAETTTQGSPATLPTDPPYWNIVGYRAFFDGTTKRCNTYYYRDPTRPVEDEDVLATPGAAVDEDTMVRSGNYINLYLKWVPVTYTIIFNKGNADGWLDSNNMLPNITKTYGTRISVDDFSHGYPRFNQRLVKDFYIQSGWIDGTQAAWSENNTKIIVTYSYTEANFPQPSYHPYYGKMSERMHIDDRWYDDNKTYVNVYPVWYPLNHRVVAHYYRKTKDSAVLPEEIKDYYNFNIDTEYLEVGSPKNAPWSENWQFMGWVQGDPPYGTDDDGVAWKWGDTTHYPNDTRTYGLFKYIDDLKDPYTKTYGVNRNSLSKADWNDPFVDLHIYAVWNINSRSVFVDGAWQPTAGMWVFINDEWKKVDQIWRWDGISWVSEIDS